MRFLILPATLACALWSFMISAQPLPAALTSIAAPSQDQFARLCANTADPADCGKKIEAQQIGRAATIVKRSGNLLAVTVPGEPPFIFEDKPGEAGPNVSFFAYHAASDAVVLYRAQADKLDFVLVHRGTPGTGGITASTTELPNEPHFNSDGRYFVTA